MPKRKEIFTTGSYYHLINRGNDGQAIFREEGDFKRFCGLIEYYRHAWPYSYSEYLRLDRSEALFLPAPLGDAKIGVVAFCLLQNHFHIMVRQLMDGGVNHYMTRVGKAYAQYFRRKYSHDGHVFMGRFEAIPIVGELQLHHAIRYIHLNPYSHEVVSTFNDLTHYPWSSFNHYTGGLGLNWLSSEIVLENFKDSGAYRDYVLGQANYQRELQTTKKFLKRQP